MVLLLVMASCGGSDSPTSTTVIATSTTTAEEALAIDGPVMRYPTTGSPSGDLDTLLQGVLQIEGDCLYLELAALAQRYPILWPAETTWDEANQSVVSPVGEVIPMGSVIEGRGGYFFLSDVHLYGGTAASNLASTCLDNANKQVAVVRNTDTAIGAKVG